MNLEEPTFEELRTLRELLSAQGALIRIVANLSREALIMLQQQVIPLYLEESGSISSESQVINC